MSENSSSVSDLNFWKRNQQCAFIFTGLFICYILLIPLFIFVLYLGYLRWRKQSSGSTSQTSSHSDVFTYNMVAMEMVSILAFFLFLCGFLVNPTTLFVGMYLFTFVTPAEYLFHILTCVDRYLAVVHPVTYLKLRQSRGVRIRNISIGCVWLICFGALCSVDRPVENILDIIFMLLSFIVVCFCSLSVLCVLIHPGPGDVSGNRARVDQSKKRAFQTITIIMVTLILRILTRMVYSVLQVDPLPNSPEGCVIVWSLAWFSVPNSLVLPLLFLHRAGKLPSCKTNTDPGP